MKLIAVLGLAQFEEELIGALKKVELPIFSQIDIKGVRDGNDQLDVTNWFGSGLDSSQSVALFGLVEQNQADAVLEVIKQLNEGQEGVNPFHAFQLAVEKYV